MSLVIREFEGPADLKAMIDLLLDVRPPQLISHWPGVVELHEVMARPAVTANTRLWLDVKSGAIGDVVGWAFVDEFDNIHFERRPGVLDQAELEAMFDWAGSVVVRRNPGLTSALSASAHEADVERASLLLRHRFIEQPYSTLSYARPLSDPIPPSVLPPGFFIRSLGPDEVEAVAALHRSAFGTGHMTVENRRCMMSGPEYDPGGDLVVVAPDGRLAAYTMASISETENAASGMADGFTDPVATHPDFQRRGLAKAVMQAGCARLRERGASRARLGTSSENLAMQRAAESAGYRLDHATRWFSLELAGDR